MSGLPVGLAISAALLVSCGDATGPGGFRVTATCDDRHMFGMAHLVIRGPTDQTLRLHLATGERGSVQGPPDTLTGVIPVARGRYRLNVVWTEVRADLQQITTADTVIGPMNMPAARTFRCPPITVAAGTIGGRTPDASR